MDVCGGGGCVVLPSVVAQAGSLLKLVSTPPFALAFSFGTHSHAPRTSPFLSTSVDLFLVSCRWFDLFFFWVPLGW